MLVSKANAVIQFCMDFSECNTRTLYVRYFISLNAAPLVKNRWRGKIHKTIEYLILTNGRMSEIFRISFNEFVQF